MNLLNSTFIGWLSLFFKGSLTSSFFSINLLEVNWTPTDNMAIFISDQKLQKAWDLTYLSDFCLPLQCLRVDFVYGLRCVTLFCWMAKLFHNGPKSCLLCSIATSLLPKFAIWCLKPLSSRDFFSLADSPYSSAFGFSIPDVLVPVHPK